MIFRAKPLWQLLRPLIPAFIGAAVVLGCLGVVASRLFGVSADEYLDFRALEEEFAEQARVVLELGATGRQYVIPAEGLRREETFDNADGVGRWSFVGQELALIAHRLRRQQLAVALADTAGGDRLIRGRLLIAEPVLPDTGDRLSMHFLRGAMNVLSPFLERRWSPVTTRDALSGLAVMSRTSVLHFQPLESIRPPDVFPPGWCAAIARSPTSLRLHCGPLHGAALDRFSQFGFSYAAGANSGVVLRVFRTTAEDGRIEGEPIMRDTVELRAGQLFRSRLFPGGFVATARTGTVVDTQFINGRRRLIVRSPRYGELGVTLSRVRGASGPFTTIPLSVSVRLSESLDSLAREVQRIVELGPPRRTLRVTNIELAAVDIRTGDALALSGSRPPVAGQPLPGTIPRWLGSATKPMLAAGVLAAHPELATLVVSGPAVVEAVAGYTLSKSFDAGCGGGATTLRRFISCSSNAHAAELLVRAIVADGVPRSIANPARLDAGALLLSATADSLVSTWDAPLSRSFGGRPYEDPWRVGDVDGVGSLLAAKHPGLLPLYPAPNLVVPTTVDGVLVDAGPTIDELSRFAFGQGPNEWTLLHAASAFARVVSGRNLQTRFLSYSASPPNPRNFSWYGNTWHRQLLLGLEDVVRAPGGTASDVGRRVDRAVGRAVRVLGKTGTATLDRDRFIERNAFVGAVSLTHDPPGQPMTDGVAFALMIDYADPITAAGRSAATADRLAVAAHRELAVRVSTILASYLRERGH